MLVWCVCVHARTFLRSPPLTVCGCRRHAHYCYCRALREWNGKGGCGRLNLPNSIPNGCPRRVTQGSPDAPGWGKGLWEARLCLSFRLRGELPPSGRDREGGGLVPVCRSLLEDWILYCCTLGKEGGVDDKDDVTEGAWGESGTYFLGYLRHGLQRRQPVN